MMPDPSRRPHPLMGKTALQEMIDRFLSKAILYDKTGNSELAEIYFSKAELAERALSAALSRSRNHQ